MSNIAIRAEGLGKKYVIGHETERERYTALRDVLARQARGLARSARDLMAGRALIAGDEREEFWALKDVAFEIGRGEVVGIIGRNGAGKSTLLKILSRITEPTEGRVTIDGRVASLLEVGTGFHPELTGRENIYLNGAILGMTRAEIRRKFDEIVDFAGVEKFLDTPVKRYSSGMYVRLAFAVAAHLEPEILIVDEVLAVGDAEFQKKCLGKMGEVARGGRTVLFVSHNVAALKRLCPVGLLLRDGKTVAMGDMESSLSKYTNSSEERRTLNRRRQGSGAVTYHSSIAIEYVECLSEHVYQGGEFELRIEVYVANPTKEVVFGIGFCSPMGGRIVSSDSDYLHMQIFNFPTTGRYALRLRITKLPLAAAHYSLDIGCRLAGGQMIDNVQDALLVCVLPSDESTIVQTSGYTTALLEGTWEFSAVCSDQRQQ